MKNVYIFGIGDRARIIPLINSLKDRDFNVVIGPTEAEHKFLYENYSYYKYSYDQKVGSFCSDVGRFFVLSKHSGMYIDTSVLIGENIDDFYSKNIVNYATFFRERKNMVASCVLFSGVENNEIFKDILELFKIKNHELQNPRIYPIAPYVISGYLKREFGDFSGNVHSFVKKGAVTISIETLLEIRNPKTIFKKGSGSGGASKNSAAAERYGQTLEDEGTKGIENKQNDRLVEIISDSCEIPVGVGNLKYEFEQSLDREKIKWLKNEYKHIAYRLKMSELLFGSILYRFFTFKGFKTR